MAQLNVDSTELTLLAVAVNEKIARLDEKRIELQTERARVGGTTDGEEINFLIRSVYASLARRIEQQLDVPFTDDEQAHILVAAGMVQ